MENHSEAGVEATPEKWDPSTEIATGSVSANAARLFGAEGLLKKPSHKAKAMPRKIQAPTRFDAGREEEPGNGGEEEAKGEKWDPSHEIARGSVSSNAARLFGANAFVKRSQKKLSGVGVATTKLSDDKEKTGDSNNKENSSNPEVKAERNIGESFSKDETSAKKPSEVKSVGSSSTLQSLPSDGEISKVASKAMAEALKGYPLQDGEDEEEALVTPDASEDDEEALVPSSASDAAGEEARRVRAEAEAVLARVKAEEEASAAAEEEARRLIAEAEAEAARIKAEKEAAAAAVEEARKAQEEAEEKAAKIEAEEKAAAAAEEEARRTRAVAKAEAAKKKAEKDAAAAAEEEARKIRAEADAAASRKKAQDAAAAAEEEARKARAEAEAEAARIQSQEEAAAAAMEEARRMKAEAEAEAEFVKAEEEATAAAEAEDHKFKTQEFVAKSTEEAAVELMEVTRESSEEASQVLENESHITKKRPTGIQAPTRVQVHREEAHVDTPGEKHIDTLAPVVKEPLPAITKEEEHETKNSMEMQNGETHPPSPPAISTSSTAAAFHDAKGVLGGLTDLANTKEESMEKEELEPLVTPISSPKEAKFSDEQVFQEKTTPKDGDQGVEDASNLAEEQAIDSQKVESPIITDGKNVDDDANIVGGGLDRGNQSEDMKDPFLGLFRICPTPPLRRTASEVLLRALTVRAYNSTSSSPEETKYMSVTVQLLSDVQRFQAELRSRTTEAGVPVDECYILPIRAAYCDDASLEFMSSMNGGSVVEVCARAGLAREAGAMLHQIDTIDPCDDIEIKASYPYVLVFEDHGQTLDEHLDCIPVANLKLARSVASDAVVGLMQLHTEGRVHRDLSPRCIVQPLSSSGVESSDKGGKTRWKVTDLGSCGEDEEVLTEEVGRKCRNWGYLPPEAAQVILSEQPGGEGKYSVATDPAWDLWSLGCVLYRLVFGSDLWKASRDGSISDEDLGHLAKWSTLDVWKRAMASFEPEERTDEEKAAIDLVAKLLAPAPEDRIRNFELGIISVHQHEFIEGRPLEPPSLLAFEQRQSLLAAEVRDRDLYLELTGNLSLEEKWELSRAKDVLLLGAFEPVVVHIPTSFVIVKRPLSSPEGEESAAERCLAEAMNWVSVLDVVGPLVRRALLEGDVRSVGHFWSKIEGMFEGSYCYFYFVDDLTGEPILQSPENCESNVYPIPIKTRSDILPKLLPLMHCTMRSMAMYHGAVGLARMFGAGPFPNLAEALRSAAQPDINCLKDEGGGIAGKPFGCFIDDIEEVKRHRELFLRDKKNVRCKALAELVRFYERKGVITPGKKRGQNDFSGLHRLADEKGRAIWTTLDKENDVKRAITKRATERLKEECDLWSVSKVGSTLQVIEFEHRLEEAVKNVDNANYNVEQELERNAAAEKRIAELEEALLETRKKCSEVTSRVKTFHEKAQGHRR